MAQKELTLGIIIKALTERKNLSFSRFGDGEWNCILGSNTKANCDGHEYFPSLQKHLKHIVSRRRDYYMGMQNLAMNLRGKEPAFQDLVKKNEWVNADILHRASARGEIKKLITALRTSKRKIILVAPEHLSGLGIADTHIIIPDNNCWLEHNKTIRALEKVQERNAVYLYCASMASNVYINYMYDKYLTTITQIDCGSLFEPYVGKATRSYHKKVIENFKG